MGLGLGLGLGLELGLGLGLGLGLEGQKARSEGSTRCAKAARHSTRPEPKVPARGDEACWWRVGEMVLLWGG